MRNAPRLRMYAARVLVADDDSDLRAIVAESLRADGMSVQEASNGAELLSKLAQGGVDLLITDVMMPALGGVEAAARARSAGVDIPVLFVTASTEAWIAESVSKLQRADVLYKPFSGDELLRRAHALLTPEIQRAAAIREKEEPHLFPPALVPLLRRSVADGGCLENVADEVLTELLSVVFFAGLEREEGERNSVRVVFVGNGPVDSEPPIDGLPPPLFRWSTLTFTTPRVFSTGQLVRLAAATVGGRVFVQVCQRHGQLVITGLSREGVNLEGDRALKLVVQRPGGLSILVGRRHVIDYERGHVQALATNVILSDGVVRAALEFASSGSGLPPQAIDRYLEAVSLLVMSLSMHGAGGILVFSADEHPTVEGETGYRTHPHVSIAAILLRLHRTQTRVGAARCEDTENDQLWVGALQSELQHTVSELGALTALDGATILDRSLALVGFGVVLPFDGNIGPVVAAEDVDAASVHEFDLAGRGTRHRAAATCAWSHPGSIVFVASQDGSLACLFRSVGAPRLLLWPLGSSHWPSLGSTL